MTDAEALALPFGATVLCRGYRYNHGFGRDVHKVGSVAECAEALRLPEGVYLSVRFYLRSQFVLLPAEHFDPFTFWDQA